MLEIAQFLGITYAPAVKLTFVSFNLIVDTADFQFQGPLLPSESFQLFLCRRELAPAIDNAVFPRMQGGPLMHIIAAKAVAFYEAMQPGFFDYQRAVLDNALALATELQRQGLRLVTGGTDNHMVLVDLTQTGVTGRQAEEALQTTGIVVNRNTIPFDARPPKITSGIRLGTPAVTTRGFGVEEMKRIAALIVQVISNIGNQEVQNQVKQEVKQMCSRFPLPGVTD